MKTKTIYKGTVHQVPAFLYDHFTTRGIHILWHHAQIETAEDFSKYTLYQLASFRGIGVVDLDKVIALRKDGTIKMQIGYRTECNDSAKRLYIDKLSGTFDMRETQRVNKHNSKYYKGQQDLIIKAIKTDWKHDVEFITRLEKAIKQLKKLNNI